MKRKNCNPPIGFVFKADTRITTTIVQRQPGFLRITTSRLNRCNLNRMILNPLPMLSLIIRRCLSELDNLLDFAHFLAIYNLQALIKLEKRASNRTCSLQD